MNFGKLISTLATFLFLGYFLYSLSGVLLTGGSMSHSDRLLDDAVDEGNVSEARRALEQGAEVNRVDGIGATALHTAAWRGDMPMARLLIEHGALVDVADDYSGETPLHSAARGDHPDMLRLLLENGADPYLRTHGEIEACNGKRYPPGVKAGDIARDFGFR